MRRYFAIFFLFLFLLYHTGYISVYWIATHQIDEYWDMKTIDSESLQKVSIHMKLPYWADQQEYRPTNGIITMNGKTYRAVLQKYAMDSLHFLVVEDFLTSHLNHSIKDWIKNTSNTTSEQHHKVAYLKSINKDYRSTETYNYLQKREFDYHQRSVSSYSFSVISFIQEIDPLPPQV